MRLLVLRMSFEPRLMQVLRLVRQVRMVIMMWVRLSASERQQAVMLHGFAAGMVGVLDVVVSIRTRHLHGWASGAARARELPQVASSLSCFEIVSQEEYVCEKNVGQLLDRCRRSGSCS